MKLTHQQASLAIVMITASVNEVNDKIADVVAITEEHQELPGDQVDKLSLCMAQLESYSATILVLLRYLPIDSRSRTIARMAQNNLSQAEKFFKETGVKYGIIPL